MITFITSDQILYLRVPNKFLQKHLRPSLPLLHHRLLFSLGRNFFGGLLRDWKRSGACLMYVLRSCDVIVICNLYYVLTSFVSCNKKSFEKTGEKRDMSLYSIVCVIIQSEKYRNCKKIKIKIYDTNLVVSEIPFMPRILALFRNLFLTTSSYSPLWLICLNNGIDSGIDPYDFELSYRSRFCPEKSVI